MSCPPQMHPTSSLWQLMVKVSRLTTPSASIHGSPQNCARRMNYPTLPSRFSGLAINNTSITTPWGNSSTDGSSSWAVRACLTLVSGRRWRFARRLRNMACALLGGCVPRIGIDGRGQVSASELRRRVWDISYQRREQRCVCRATFASCVALLHAPKT